MTKLSQRVAECLDAREPSEKVKLTRALYKDWCAGKVEIDRSFQPAEIGEVGRPEKPQLVAPREVKKRSMNTEEGRVALCHALTHIEFNAINLALDAAYRFIDMPDQFYSDWLKVADEEAYHFNLLESYLNKRNCQYGDHVAHNGLWEMAQLTAYDVMVRMALVPRVLEARGLDVTPGIISKLQQARMMSLLLTLKLFSVMKLVMLLLETTGLNIYVSNVSWITGKHLKNLFRNI